MSCAFRHELLLSSVQTTEDLMIQGFLTCLMLLHSKRPLYWNTLTPFDKCHGADLKSRTVVHGGGGCLVRNDRRCGQLGEHCKFYAVLQRVLTTTGSDRWCSGSDDGCRHCLIQLLLSADAFESKKVCLDVLQSQRTTPSMNWLLNVEQPLSEFTKKCNDPSDSAQSMLKI